VVSVEFLHAPIPRKGSGSTTATFSIYHSCHGVAGNLLRWFLDAFFRFSVSKGGAKGGGRAGKEVLYGGSERVNQRRVRSKITPRNLGAWLNEREMPVKASERKMLVDPFSLASTFRPTWLR